MSNLVRVATAVDLVPMECGNCGVIFAVSELFQRERREKGGDWYCPNGHCRVYREPDIVKERRLRERAEQRAANLEDDLRLETLSHRATKGQLTKTRRRIGRGVCPCCQRHFVNVERHMATRHPDFVAEPAS